MIQDWEGQSGRLFPFEVLGSVHDAEDKPAEFIFELARAEGWYAIYIGETESAAGLTSRQPFGPCVRRNGATHAHVYYTRVTPEPEIPGVR